MAHESELRRLSVNGALPTVQLQFSPTRIMSAKAGVVGGLKEFPNGVGLGGMHSEARGYSTIGFKSLAPPPARTTFRRIFGWLRTTLLIPYGDGPKPARISTYKDRPPVVTRKESIIYLC